MRKIRFVVCAAAPLALAVAIVALGGPGRARAAESVDRVVASVDGNPITMHDVRALSAAAGHPLPPGDITSTPAFKTALKAVIGERLLQAEVTKYEDKVDESQVNNYIKNLEQQHAITDEQLRASLMQSGVSYDDFRKHVRLEIEKAMMINDEVRSQIDIPESEIRAYYEAHKADFTIKQERYRLAQILIAVPPQAPPNVVAAARAKAEALDKRARAGEDFATLARQNSDDESKSQGGELGYFKPGEINEQILAAIKTLKPGQVSGVVRSHYGFHIIKLEAHEVAGVQPLAGVKDHIRDTLVNQAARGRIESWVDNDLVKKHYVETMY
jgi:peptidyl-prolyl cis-trans isomerase SurA